jgi:hypothetical protein
MLLLLYCSYICPRPTALAVVLRHDPSAKEHSLRKNQTLAGLQVFDRSDGHTKAGKARKKKLKALLSAATNAQASASPSPSQTHDIGSGLDSDDTKPIAVLAREMTAKAKQRAALAHVQQMSSDVQEYIAAVGFIAAAAAESGSSAALCLRDVKPVVEECHRHHAHKFLKLFTGRAI